MFKNQEQRSTAILIFMGIITILFLLYLIIPLEKGNKNTLDSDPTDSKTQKNNSLPINLKQIIKNDLEQNPFIKINNRLINQLKILYHSIADSNTPFRTYEIKPITGLITEFENTSYKNINVKDITRYFKFSFKNLPEIVKIEFPAELPSELKFNLYLALFLQKILEENIYEQYVDLSQSQLLATMDLSPYRVLNNEIEADYQSLPVLFYFSIFSRGLDMFPSVSPTEEFVFKIKKILDLSDGKNLNKICDYFNFSKSSEDFYIKWTEYDNLNSDDTQQYPDQKMRVYTFAKKIYLKIPGSNISAELQWLKDLCNSDSGNIEINDLIIRNQAQHKGQFIKKIFYSPLRPQFTVLLKDTSPATGFDFIDKVISARFQDYLRTHTVVSPFPINKEDKIQRQRLAEFGIYLKKILLKSI